MFYHLTDSTIQQRSREENTEAQQNKGKGFKGKETSKTYTIGKNSEKKGTYTGTVEWKVKDEKKLNRNI